MSAKYFILKVEGIGGRRMIGLEQRGGDWNRGSRRWDKKGQAKRRDMRLFL